MMMKRHPINQWSLINDDDDDDDDDDDANLKYVINCNLMPLSWFWDIPASSRIIQRHWLLGVESIHGVMVEYWDGVRYPPASCWASNK